MKTYTQFVGSSLYIMLLLTALGLSGCFQTTQSAGYDAPTLRRQPGSAGSGQGDLESALAQAEANVEAYDLKQRAWEMRKMAAQAMLNRNRVGLGTHMNPEFPHSTNVGGFLEPVQPSTAQDDWIEAQDMEAFNAQQCDYWKSRVADLKRQISGQKGNSGGDQKGGGRGGGHGGGHH